MAQRNKPGSLSSDPNWGLPVEEPIETPRRRARRELPDATGQIEAGNINDLDTRPAIEMSDGRQGTIYSVTFQEDHRDPSSPWVLAPSIYDGKLHDAGEAEDRYRQTGLHLGKFDTLDNNESYAGRLSEHQDGRPSKPGSLSSDPNWGLPAEEPDPPLKKRPGILSGWIT